MHFFLTRTNSLLTNDLITPSRKSLLEEMKLKHTKITNNLFYLGFKKNNNKQTKKQHVCYNCVPLTGNEIRF